MGKGLEGYETTRKCGENEKKQERKDNVVKRREKVECRKQTGWGCDGNLLGWRMREGSNELSPQIFTRVTRVTRVSSASSAGVGSRDSGCGRGRANACELVSECEYVGCVGAQVEREGRGAAQRERQQTLTPQPGLHRSHRHLLRLGSNIES